MVKEGIAARLRALASDDKKRTKAARLRDVIDDVEAALAAGVPRQTVVSELAKHGLAMSMPTFETTMKRIRRQRARKPPITSAPETAQVVLPAPAVPAGNDDTVAVTPSASHNPADISAILQATPDLAQLATFAKKGKRK